MKFEEYGFFYLKYGNSKKRLLFKNNFVSVNNDLYITETPNVSSLITVSVNDFEISVMNLNQEIYVNEVPQEKSFFSIKENDIIKVNDYEFQLLFEVISCEKLNELLDMFLDGNLPDYFDIQKLFVEYAQNKRITNKQAGFILASIDVPELDINV